MRSKLRLNLEQLTVDSFQTSAAEKPKGTVFGEQCTCYTNCTCPGCPTCNRSCNGTCDATACGTCGVSCGGTCDNTCDYSCGGTCDNTCGPDTCDYTCAGFATYVDINQFCVLC